MKKHDVRHAVWVALGVSLIVLVDQVVKAWARGAAHEMQGRIIAEVIPRVFEIKLVFNEGIAFGMAQGGGRFLTPIAVVVCGVALFLSVSRPRDPRVFHVTMVALAGGSLGNLIDRLRFGRVTDMFYFRLIDFPVFNVADVAISTAGALLVLAGLMDVVKSKRDGDGVRNPSPDPEV